MAMLWTNLLIAYQGLGAVAADIPPLVALAVNSYMRRVPRGGVLHTGRHEPNSDTGVHAKSIQHEVCTRPIA